MKTLGIIFAVLLLTLAAMAGTAVDLNVQSSAWVLGQKTVIVLPGASVFVCSPPAIGNPCSNRVSVYSDAALTVPLTQPLIADANGHTPTFYLAGPTVYTYTVTTPTGELRGPYVLTVPAAVADLNSPPPIGGTNPSTGAFTTLSADSIALDGNQLQDLLDSKAAINAQFYASQIRPGTLQNGIYQFPGTVRSPQLSNIIGNTDVVCAGDSITAGQGVATAERFCDVAQNLSALKGNVNTYVNTGVPGWRVTNLVSDYNAHVKSYCQAAGGAASQTLLNVYVGTNDLAGGVSASDIFTTLSGYWATAKADGCKVVAWTIPLRHGPYALTSGQDIQRIFLNDSIRKSSGWDYLVDTDAHTKDIADDMSWFSSSDGVHPNALLHRYLAQLLNSVLYGSSAPAPLENRAQRTVYAKDLVGSGGSLYFGPNEAHLSSASGVSYLTATGNDTSTKGTITLRVANSDVSSYIEPLSIDPSGKASLKYGMSSDGGFKHQRFTLTSTAATDGALAETAVTWTAAFADTNYTVSCTNNGNGVGNLSAVFGVHNKTAAGFTIRVTNTKAEVNGGVAECIAVHD